MTKYGNQKGIEEGKKERGKQGEVYKRENKWKKEGGKLERGRKNMEMGNDLNNWLQMWDDNPLWVVRNP